MFALSAAWPVLHIVLLCPLPVSSAWFFCKASSLIFRVRLWPLQSLWNCFWMFVVHFWKWLKNHSSNEETTMFRVVRVASVGRPFGVPMDGPHAKCSLCNLNTFMFIVATPQFCITQCLEWIPSHGMHSRTLLYPLVRARRRCQTSLLYSGDAQTFVAADSKQDWGLASNIQCLAWKITTAWLLRTKAQGDKSVQPTRILVEFSSRNPCSRLGGQHCRLCCGPQPVQWQWHPQAVGCTGETSCVCDVQAGLTLHVQRESQLLSFWGSALAVTESYGIIHISINFMNFQCKLLIHQTNHIMDLVNN